MQDVLFFNRGYQLGKYRKRRHPVLGIVFHTVGVGLWSRWSKESAGNGGLQKTEANVEHYTWETWKTRVGKEYAPFDTAIRVYASLMNEGPHFVICGESGRIAQGTPLAYEAQHCGASMRKEYAKGYLGKNRNWWKKRWKELSSPSDLLDGNLWKVYSPNAVMIGIEVSPSREDPYKEWSEACYNSIKKVYEFCRQQHPTLMCDKYHILSHSDIDPERRGTSAQPTDPGPTQWISSIDMVTRLLN
jgi:hypothetical protein